MHRQQAKGFSSRSFAEGRGGVATGGPPAWPTAPNRAREAVPLPGHAAGWLVVGLPAAPTALFPSGPALAVDITGPFALIPWTTDAAGYAHLQTGLPSTLGGAQVAAQAVFLDPNSCNALGLAWTHGLSIHVAP